MSIDQAEMQLALEKYFNFSLQTLFRSHTLIQQNKVSPSFIKGSLHSPFTISGIVSDNNTTYSCKVQSKEPGKVVTTCSCKKHSPLMACEHILSLFYDFYQQQILQGSLLHNEEPEQDDLSQCAQSPRFGIIMRSPQDLLCKRRATSFNELNFKLTSGQEINLTDSPVRPFLGVININLVAAADETGKTIIKNNHPLYYVSLSLLMHDQVLKKINLLGMISFSIGTVGKHFLLRRNG